MRTYRITEEDDSDSGAGIIIALVVIGAILTFVIKVLAYVLPVAAVVGIVVLIVKLRKKSKEKKMQEEINAAEKERTEKKRAMDELSEWKSLLERGAITKSEFETQKSQLLRKINQPSATDDVKLLT